MNKGRNLIKTIRSFRTLHRPTPPMDSSERYCYNPSLIWNPQVEAYFIEAYGADHFSRISKALTRPSCYSCIRVNRLKTTSDAVIEKLLTIIQEARPESATDSENISKTEAFADFDAEQKQKKLFERN